MKLKSTIYSLSMLALLSACSTKRDYTYLQNMVPDVTYTMTPRQEVTVRPDDRLDIRVSCKIPELAVPFNISADMASAGYNVNPQGDIQMPIIGRIHVSGKTLEEVQSEIAWKLIAGDYIKDPVVSARFLNFRYSVIGAVGSPGQYSVDGDRVTILEAIARAGNLSTQAVTDRVAVIREETDGRKMYLHDINSTDLFQSPCFYLQQNDVVLVEAKHKDEKAESRAWQVTTIAISAASVVSTIIWATK